MPGIAGIIAANSQPENQHVVQAMSGCMLHEKFYVSGTNNVASLGVAMGWVSLAGSFSDCMPVWNETKDICLVFSGETYPDSQELDHLRKRGHTFNPTNAEYLIHSYEELGRGFLDHLNGWFSGLLLDLREKKVLLFNDRYGIGRLYYHENEAGLYFSSEAKSLLKVLPELRELDLRSLGEFFSCGCPLQNRTLFKRISLLPPASVCTFEPGKPPRKESYFSVSQWQDQPSLEASDYYDRLKS